MEPDPLTSDVAQKVLRADLQNTVAKVAAGKQLAGPERQRFEAAAVPPSPTADDLARLKANRQSALIRRWASGGKLTPDEMAEVHPILPAEVLASSPVGGHVPTTEPTEDSRHVSTRQKYFRSYEDYANQLGVGLRTVKRWVAVGKKAGDPCPLDDLPRFPEWYAKHLPYAIKASVLAVCAGKPPEASGVTPGDAAGVNVASGAASSSAPPPPPGTPPPSAAPTRLSINVHDLAAIGLHENLARLSRIHHANIELLEKAFTGSSETELSLRQRNVQASGRMLKDAQQAFDAYQESRGELVPVADVKTDLQRVHTAMAQSLVSLLVGLGITRERAIATADKWFRHLRESRFASGAVPDLSDLKPPVASAA